MLFSTNQNSTNGVYLNKRTTTNYNFLRTFNSATIPSQPSTNNDIFQQINNQLNSNIQNINENNKKPMFKKKKGCGCGSRK